MRAREFDNSTGKQSAPISSIAHITREYRSRPRQTLFWEKKTARAAVCDGDWKLIRFPDRPAKLYDLSKA